MGRLIYGAQGECIDLDDRTLAHLQVVMGAKLRRDEKFMLSWENYGPPLDGDHSSIWIHPTMSLRFTYFGTRKPSLNRDWIELLVLSANSPSGLRVVSEPSASHESAYL